MKNVTRLKIGPVALLVLLALLTLLVVKRRYLTAQEAEDGAVRKIVNVENTVVRDPYVAVAVLAVVAMLALVTWAALRVGKGEDQARPRAGESSASGTTGFR
jgi:hypothetical protein